MSSRGPRRVVAVVVAIGLAGCGSDRPAGITARVVSCKAPSTIAGLDATAQIRLEAEADFDRVELAGDYVDADGRDVGDGVGSVRNVRAGEPRDVLVGYVFDEGFSGEGRCTIAVTSAK